MLVVCRINRSDVSSRKCCSLPTASCSESLAVEGPNEVMTLCPNAPTCRAWGTGVQYWAGAHSLFNFFFFFPI